MIFDPSLFYIYLMMAFALVLGYPNALAALFESEKPIKRIPRMPMQIRSDVYPQLWFTEEDPRRFLIAKGPSKIIPYMAVAYFVKDAALDLENPQWIDTYTGHMGDGLFASRQINTPDRHGNWTKWLAAIKEIDDNQTGTR